MQETAIKKKGICPSFYYFIYVLAINSNWPTAPLVVANTILTTEHNHNDSTCKRNQTKQNVRPRFSGIMQSANHNRQIRYDQSKHCQPSNHRNKCQNKCRQESKQICPPKLASGCTAFKVCIICKIQFDCCAERYRTIARNIRLIHHRLLITRLLVLWLCISLLLIIRLLVLRLCIGLLLIVWRRNILFCTAVRAECCSLLQVRTALSA